MPNSRNQRFIIAEFYDGIQVIPKTWLQSKDSCKYPSHYKTYSRIRKAIEKEEVPTANWSSFKIDRIFGEYCRYLSKITFSSFAGNIYLLLIIFKIFSVSLCNADEKAKQALYTSDMDTDKEARGKRKYRAKKDVSSSESEEESSTEIILPSPPRPPVKRKYKQ